MISAIETDYPNIKQYGCFFHYSKAIYREIQDFGLGTAYRENPMLKRFFRKFMAVPLLPENRVLEMLVVFLNDPQVTFTVEQFPILTNVPRYFHRSWVITFPINMWNVFERPSRLWTTSFCEGWNKAWNMHTRRSSLNNWLAIKILKIQQKSTQNQVNHMRLGRLPPPQKRKLRLYIEGILALKNSLILGNRGIINYWNTMCHLCQSI